MTSDNATGEIKVSSGNLNVSSDKVGGEAASCKDFIVWDFKNDTALGDSLTADGDALMCKWAMEGE